LIQALEGSRTRLIAAADLRKARAASEGELSYGDAAAAILVGQGDVIARVLHLHSSTVDFVDHFREADQPYDYGWEARWIRDEGYTKLLGGAIEAALQGTGLTGADIRHAVIPITTKGVGAGLAKKAGVAPEALIDPLAANVGDSGTAHPLLLLCAALECAKPGERILVAGFGQGADVLILEATEALARLAPRKGVAGNLADRQEDSNYMRFLFHRGVLDVERGMRAEMDQKQPGTTLFRNRKAVLGLVGGRDVKTGTVQFPKSDIGVNPNDRSAGPQEDYPLAEKRARVVTYTADSLTFSPDPPTWYGTIDFEGGGRMVAEFAEVTAEDVKVGAELRMVFRIKALDDKRHFTKYFWKAMLVRGESNA
jgi:uncharacterized OB-fold protein